ncbi:MAG: 30S ribosome-binding factor RbfA [Firmicutes bacterium]|nr:30S ribosome-binding factor RbfA [Bacillota bacterium]
MAKGYRQVRMGEEIRRIMSDLILRELQDPRISGRVSITAVDVTADGSFATVYLSVFEQGLSEEEMANVQEDVLEAMQSAKGFMKREIGKQIRVRHMPDLIFKIDKSMDYGRHMDELIDKVMKEQNEK